MSTGGRHHISAFDLTRAPFRPPYTGRWVDKPLRMRLRASTPRVGRANPLSLGGESSTARTTSAFTPGLSGAERGGVALHGAASPHNFLDEPGCNRALVIGLAGKPRRRAGRRSDTHPTPIPGRRSMIRLLRRYLTRRALKRLEAEHARLKAIAASNRKGAQVAAHQLRAVTHARLTLEVGR